MAYYGTFTSNQPVKIDKIVKTTSDSGDDYKTQGSSPEANINLITAKNVISPTTAKDCVLDYEKALLHKDGVFTVTGTLTRRKSNNPDFIDKEIYTVIKENGYFGIAKEEPVK